jgi:hypothetical protein
MTFTYSKKQLTRDEVVAEVATRARRLGMDDSLEDTALTMGIAREVVEDPVNVIHHRLPDRCLTDENAYSDYFYLIACDALALI